MKIDAEQLDDDGLHHRFRAKTKKTFQHFKKDATFELTGSWASFLIGSEWRDKTLHLSAPGATGTLTLVEGVAVVGEIHLDSWPATSGWVKDKIIREFRGAMETVSEVSNLQAEENTLRANIKAAAEKKWKACQALEKDATVKLTRWEISNDVINVLVAVMGTGSAFAVWSGNQGGKVRTAVGVAVGLVAALGTVQAVLKASDQIKHWSEIKGHFVRLKNDLESFINDIAFQPEFLIPEFQERFQGYEQRFTEGDVLWRTDILSWFWSTFGRSPVISPAALIGEPPAAAATDAR